MLGLNKVTTTKQKHTSERRNAKPGKEGNPKGFTREYTLHGHTRIFALGLFVDLGISPCKIVAPTTALCAFCENESKVLPWFEHTHGS